MLSEFNNSLAEDALADAERKGFRLAVIGRTCALVAFALFYLTLYGYPNNVYVAGVILLTAIIGLAPLRLVHSKYERPSRFALFTFDCAAASAINAFAPLSSGGDVPQNLFFFPAVQNITTLSLRLLFWPCRRHWSCGPDFVA